MPPHLAASDRPLDPTPWTRADIEEALKNAFLRLPYTPIYSPRGNTLEALGDDDTDGVYDILTFSGTVLGDSSEERRIVLLWARSIAMKGQVGGSVGEFCLSRGWDRSTFDRRRKRYCQRIADAKNRAEGQNVG